MNLQTSINLNFLQAFCTVDETDNLNYAMKPTVKLGCTILNKAKWTINELQTRVTVRFTLSAQRYNIHVRVIASQHYTTKLLDLPLVATLKLIGGPVG